MDIEVKRLMKSVFNLREHILLNYIVIIFTAGSIAYYRVSNDDLFDIQSLFILWFSWIVFFRGLQELTYNLGLLIIFIFKYIRERYLK